MALPVYLYTGPEFGNRNDAVEAVKKSLAKQNGVVEEHLFYLTETPFSQVMMILQSGTLFSNAVFVVCKAAEVLKKKDDLEQLSSWLESKPEENAVLVLISDEISVDSKLEKLVPASNRQKFWEMYDDKKVPWVKTFFSKNGYGIEEEAAELILDMVENNTQTLKNECSRFFLCFSTGHVITVDDVESVLTHDREESPFTLFDCIADVSVPAGKRLEGAVSILQKIRLSKENSSVMFIAGLASCFRKLSLWHKINEGGYADDFALKTNGFGSSLMQKQYRKAAKVWNLGQTTAILAILAATDMEIRSGGTLMEDILLQKMLYEIIIKKGAQMSTAEY